jgi:hypothetical protein
MAFTDFGLPFQIGLASRSTSVSLADVVKVTMAINLQISRDFAPLWGVSATVVAVPNPDAIDPGIWPIFVQDDIGAAAAGFHLTRRNQPYALVESGPTWSLTASHECLELIADPTGNRLYPSLAITVAADGKDFADHGDNKLEYLVEVCDPCEDASCAYLINDVLVSDFYTPRYFDPTALPSVRYSFSGKITRPRQVSKNGYLSWLDPAGRGFRQARNLDGPDIIAIPMPPDADRANTPLRGLLDRVARRPQQSNLDPKSELARAQDRRQNWLGIAAAVRAAQYVETPVPETGPLGGAALFGAARPAAAPQAERSAKYIGDLIAANRQKFALPGVITVRPGRQLVDGWPQQQRAIVVIADPAQREGVAVRMPSDIEGVPLGAP